jgi:cytochrome oxidase Cu insertion factor (SCO1/SenC/PrrC family)
MDLTQRGAARVGAVGKGSGSVKFSFGALKRIGSISVLALAIAVVCAACGGGSSSQEQPLGPGLVGLSPKLVLYNQQAKPLELRALTGRPILIAFIDTACTGLCRMTTTKLHHVADELGAEQSQKVQFVLVTYNPVFDGPKRLASYAEEMQLDPSRWTLLTGTPDNIDWTLGRFGLPPVGRIEDPAQLMDALDYVFLVGPNGQILKKYKGGELSSTVVSQDTRTVLNQRKS